MNDEKPVLHRWPFIFTACVFLLVACALDPLVADASGAPNLVYILVDDMGYGDVSALKPESKIQTPHIDQFASEGMRFTDAHSEFFALSEIL